MANRIVGSVFWDHVNSVVKQTRRDLNVSVYHIVDGQKTTYQTQLSTADEGDPEIDAEAQLRAKEVVSSNGSKTTFFRIQCRFKTAHNEDGLIGFDQTGRIENDFPVVDKIVDRYCDDITFTPWTDT